MVTDADRSQIKTALIFGISGQDGSYLAKALLERGYDVHGTSRDKENNAFAGLKRLDLLGRVHLHSAALTDFRSVSRVLNQVVPDEIYGLAGQTSVALSFDQPLEAFESIAVGTINILECMRLLQKPIRFFNAASGECFGETVGLADEMTPFRPRSPYAMAKAAAFWTVANYRDAYGMYACSGILFNHESPLRPERFVIQKIVVGALRIAAGQADKLSLGNIAIERDWGWGPEYVDAMWRMLQNDRPADFVIATGQTHTLTDVIDIAFGALGLDWRKHVEHDSKFERPADVSRTAANPARIQSVLGWRAEMTLDGIISAMIDDKRASYGLAGPAKKMPQSG